LFFGSYYISTINLTNNKIFKIKNPINNKSSYEHGLIVLDKNSNEFLSFGNNKMYKYKLLENQNKFLVNEIKNNRNKC